MLPFGRLIRIGRRADGDRLAALHLAQVPAQQPGRLLLDVDFALEVEPVAHLHVFVGVARVAVLAGEFAATVGIDGPLERHARSTAAVEQRACFEGEILHVVPGTHELTLGRQARDSHQPLSR